MTIKYLIKINKKLVISSKTQSKLNLMGHISLLKPTASQIFLGKFVHLCLSVSKYGFQLLFA